MAKWWWRFEEEREALWRRVIVAKYGVGIPSRVPRYKVLVLWGNILRFGNVSSCSEGSFSEGVSFMVSRVPF